MNIPEKFSNQFASYFTTTCLNNVKHPLYGAHQVIPQQIRYASGEYKNALYKEIKEALERKPIEISLWKKLFELNKRNMDMVTVKAVHPKKFPAGEKTIMLQVNNNTLQCITKNKTWYESDTFNRQYETITEAKDHTLELYIQGYFTKT